MLVAVVNSGIVFTVPPVVVTSDEVSACAAAAELAATLPVAFASALPLAATGGAASTNAEARNPPTVSASPAFNAYGALTSSTRACSACPETCTPTQRACSEVNSSDG